MTLSVHFLPQNILAFDKPEDNKTPLLNGAWHCERLIGYGRFNAEFMEKEVQGDWEKRQRGRKEMPGRQKVSRAASTSRQYWAVQFSLSFSIATFSLSIPPPSSCYSLLPCPLHWILLSFPLLLFQTHTHKLLSQFNHQLKMTAGTEKEEKGIVRVCDLVVVGGYREVMRQRKRGGEGGRCAWQARKRANEKRRRTEKGTHSSNESWG